MLIDTVFCRGKKDYCFERILGCNRCQHFDGTGGDHVMVDVEIVVRCRDCQYAEAEDDGYFCTNAEGMDVNTHLSGEEYCSCGKPRQSEPP